MQVVTIEVTNACINRCIGCFVGRSGNKKISLSKFKTLLKRLPDVEAITLSGGEPMLLPNINKYCDEVYRIKKIKPTIFTSGAVNHDLIHKLNVKKIHVTIKYPNDLDDRWKDLPDAFNHACHFLRICKDYSIPTWINWAVDKSNFLFIKEMLNLAIEYKSKILVLPFIAFNDRYSRFVIPYKFYCRYFQKLNHPLIKLGVECDICRAGVTRCAIDVDGNVRACIYLQEVFGNIFEEKFEDIQNRMEEWREEQGYCKCLAINEKI
ncbi:MAG TPA: radical SAM protein [Candidatus Altiarchaeales archaeon]|nr:radical SAM protein [Candidatus Altiarchaeales archaeon]